MPFKNMAQVKACWAKNDPRWNCDEWLKRYGKPKAKGQTTKPKR